MAKRKINTEIQRALEEMEELEIGSQEYKVAAESLKLIIEAKSKGFLIEPKDILNGALYIGGMVLFLYFEQVHIVSSKWLSHLRRL